jgi:hypothetical protein
MPPRLIVAYLMIAALFVGFVWGLWHLTAERREYNRYLRSMRRERNQKNSPSLDSEFGRRAASQDPSLSRSGRFSSIKKIEARR